MALLLPAECEQYFLFKYFNILIKDLASVSNLHAGVQRHSALHCCFLNAQAFWSVHPYYSTKGWSSAFGLLITFRIWYFHKHIKKLSVNFFRYDNSDYFCLLSMFQVLAYTQTNHSLWHTFITGRSQKTFSETKVHFPASMRIARHSRCVSHSLELPFMLALCWEMSHLISFNTFQVVFSYIEV